MAAPQRWITPDATERPLLLAVPIGPGRRVPVRANRLERLPGQRQGQRNRFLIGDIDGRLQGVKGATKSAGRKIEGLG